MTVKGASTNGQRWDKCIASEGEYFEGDKNDVLNNT
jgi:hypothetical protein